MHASKGAAMRKRTIAAAALAAALALPATAASKGPESATMSGPGISGALPIRGNGEGDPGTPLGALTQDGGFFPLVFGQSPDPTLRSRPTGDLGPAYRVVFVVPGPSGRSRLVMTVYPYATGGPVTHMRPLQSFWGGETTYGGWYRAPASLKTTLVGVGLPPTPPAPSSDDGFWWSNGAFASVGAAALLGLALLMGAALAVRRRHGPAAAH